MHPILRVQTKNAVLLSEKGISQRFLRKAELSFESLSIRKSCQAKVQRKRFQAEGTAGHFQCQASLDELILLALYG